jgi:hypothetical protein
VLVHEFLAWLRSPQLGTSGAVGAQRLTAIRLLTKRRSCPSENVLNPKAR